MPQLMRCFKRPHATAWNLYLQVCEEPVAAVHPQSVGSLASLRQQQGRGEGVTRGG